MSKKLAQAIAANTHRTTAEVLTHLRAVQQAHAARMANAGKHPAYRAKIRNHYHEWLAATRAHRQVFSHGSLGSSPSKVGA